MTIADLKTVYCDDVYITEITTKDGECSFRGQSYFPIAKVDEKTAQLKIKSMFIVGKVLFVDVEGKTER